jgi:hypothetical protein
VSFGQWLLAYLPAIALAAFGLAIMGLYLVAIWDPRRFRRVPRRQGGADR